MKFCTPSVRAIIASAACVLAVPFLGSAPAQAAAASTGVPTRIGGYWWSDAQSPTALTPRTGLQSPGAEWTYWGQDDTADYGVPGLVSAKSEGISSPPAGDRVIKLRHSGRTSPFGADQSSGPHNEHKLYKQFTAKTWPSGTEPTNRNDGSPANVSGRYITYLYLRSSQMALTKHYWSNIMQFKEDYVDVNGRFVSNPSYWVGFNADDPAHPVLNLSSWGGRHHGPTTNLTQFYNKWTKFELRVYQGDRIQLYINDKLFDTAYNSEYPVGRMDFPGRTGSGGSVVSRTLGWTFGVGNYNNGDAIPSAASGVYVDLSCLLPLP
jgi:hypothetical protein